MRLFIGVSLPETTRSYLKSIQDVMLSHAIKKHTTRPENFHITLLFLGELDGSVIDDIIHTLETHLKHAKAFPIKLGTVGSFVKGDDQILWVGVGDGFKKLSSLADMVRKAMDAIALPYEKRKFRPHITLARQVRFSGNHTTPISDDDRWIPIQSVILYKSHRVYGELTYTPLYSFPLKEAKE